MTTLYCEQPCTFHLWLLSNHWLLADLKGPFLAGYLIIVTFFESQVNKFPFKNIFPATDWPLGARVGALGGGQLLQAKNWAVEEEAAASEQLLFHGCQAVPLLNESQHLKTRAGRRQDTSYSGLRWKTALLDPLIPIFVGKDMESSFIFPIWKIHSSWKTCNPNLHTHTHTLTHTRRRLSRWLTKIPSAREWAVYFSSQVWIQRKFAGKITNNSLSTKWAIYLHILHLGSVFFPWYLLPQTDYLWEY